MYHKSDECQGPVHLRIADNCESFHSFDSTFTSELKVNAPDKEDTHSFYCSSIGVTSFITFESFKLLNSINLKGPLVETMDQNEFIKTKALVEDNFAISPQLKKEVEESNSTKPSDTIVKRNRIARLKSHVKKFAKAIKKNRSLNIGCKDPEQVYGPKGAKIPLFPGGFVTDCELYGKDIMCLSDYKIGLNNEGCRNRRPDECISMTDLNLAWLPINHPLAKDSEFVYLDAEIIEVHNGFDEYGIPVYDNRKSDHRRLMRKLENTFKHQSKTQNKQKLPGLLHPAKLQLQSKEL